MDDIINNYENIIKEKDNIILDLKEKIKKLEETLTQKEKEKENDRNDNLYNNFNIKSKNSINRLNYHKKGVNCLTILNDGRLVSGSSDNSIIIYNNITYEPDLIIKEHNDIIVCITKLSSGILDSCSRDKTIKLFDIKEKNYEILQTLDYHLNWVFKIIELYNNNLVSCSLDENIIFYFKYNSQYQVDYKITTKGSCSSIIQTKENEICYFDHMKDNGTNICFFDLNLKKIKSIISYKNINNHIFRTFNMITKDLLIIGGKNKISIININQYKIVKEIEVQKSNISGFCMLNEKMFLTGDDNGIIRQWKIEGNNLILVSKKEKSHDGVICAFMKLGNGLIASCSFDNSIKIW